MEGKAPPVPFRSPALLAEGGWTDWAQPSPGCEPYDAYCLASESNGTRTEEESGQAVDNPVGVHPTDTKWWRLLRSNKAERARFRHWTLHEPDELEPGRRGPVPTGPASDSDEVYNQGIKAYRSATLNPGLATPPSYPGLSTPATRSVYTRRSRSCSTAQPWPCHTRHPGPFSGRHGQMQSRLGGDGSWAPMSEPWAHGHP